MNGVAVGDAIDDHCTLRCIQAAMKYLVRDRADDLKSALATESTGAKKRIMTIAYVSGTLEELH